MHPDNKKIKVVDHRQPFIPIHTIIFTEYRQMLGRTAIDVYMQLIISCTTGLTTMTVEHFQDLAHRCELSPDELATQIKILQCASLVLYGQRHNLHLITLIEVKPLNKGFLRRNLIIDLPEHPCADIVHNRLQTVVEVTP